MCQSEVQVPPRSVQIKLQPYSEVGDDYNDAFSEIRSQVDESDVIYIDFQEIRPSGVPGPPVELYAIIAAKSAAGASGILAVNEIYQYIKSRYVSEDKEKVQKTNEIPINIEHIHVNLEKKARTKQECREETKSNKANQSEIAQGQRETSNSDENQEER